ncbi:microtubule organization protein AKNA isoform X1 [Onychostruthus taczanowskii]|uniref:microtubule organization protein AKNA isoform X1 n=1 Tax=Onychostruthus taczanowskii TaxID=356909 RepID=UPI001B80E0C3|nr:microtubule organization protein AKNA isoform X1 [Onychostruthus taczanowskii]XP_041262909.1 microtubule organization protein AKNA isoform X1 [Onychostruthus taczanowskii]
MASPAPWLRWTQTELTRLQGEEEEEEEEEDDFERRMDEDGVIGLGEGARSPPGGDSEDLEEGSPAEEGRWHRRQEEDEERGSSGGDEGPWGAESDGDPYPELSSGGRWGSGSSDSPEAMRDGRALCQPRGCSTDWGDTSALSDTSPGPGTPSSQHRGWGTAGDTIGGHRQEWSPRGSLPVQLSTDGPSPERVPGTAMAPAGLAPSGQPRGAGNPAAPQGHGRSRVPKKAAPAVVPPKPARQSRSLSPRRRTGAKGMKDPSGTGTEGTQYGRGRLNHPLPDLSKVEARVKFDQSYRPPRGRVLPARPRGPIGFKSPAEIVREVLLSSGEGAAPQPPSTAGLPQEFRSPRQATALVQQLQDDYHKLLTKYAEAENTIDQLRLGARVSLFSDPPQPSRSLAMGTVATGSRVMTLSIPQARTAALGTATAPATASVSPGAAAAPGPSEQGGSPQPRSPPPPGGGCPTCPGPCCCPGPRLTRALAGQSRRLQAQVESFESWVRAGTPTPSEQLQRMRMLKDAQDALEREYLRGRQQLPEAAAGFDPDRAVEGEIYRLGLRLEGLKDRLEPGGRRQPLPQPFPQPPPQSLPQPPPQTRCPPAPSPPPAAHSSRPESPALVEDPRGTAGDSEGVAGGLPWPLWHKQRQVEEDFGDLLEQYKHFKSLPESLSLERLSLAGSGSQEEVDAPTARDGGPSKVPCRTRSLEEGPNLEPLPLHLPQRRTATLPPREPPNLEGIQGHRSPAAPEEPPASAKPPLGVPGPPRVPLSLGGTGSSATQHGPHKEQRIVSPETDSGFVGSEASRVSPPVHTPEHHPPGPGAPGSLGPSVPIPSSLRTPRKRQTTPLPSERALMGIYPPGGTGGAQLPPSSPSQSSSPPRWAESAGSEVGPDPDADGREYTGLGEGERSGGPWLRFLRFPDLHVVLVSPSLEGGVCQSLFSDPSSLCSPSSPAHTDSEVGDRSCASAGGHPPAMARSPTSPLPSPETPSPTLLSPDLPSLDPAHCDLLGSRLERDQAIRALQDEVWRLRRRLEESLLRSRSHPEGKAAPLVTSARRQPVASGPSAPQDPAPSGEPSPPVRGRVAPGVTPTRRARSASLPRDKPELDLGLELGPSGCHPPSLSSAAASESEPLPAGPRAPPALRKHLGKSPGAVTFRGQYAGTRYQAGTPRATPAPREEPGTSVCPRCHRGRTASAAFGGGDTSRQPQHSTPRRTSCPTCRAPTGSRDTATHAERGPGGSCPPGPHTGAEKPEQPGIWYLAAPPAATAATVCLAPVPLVPYVPSMLYCSPAVPTSAPALAGVPLGIPVGPRQAERPPRPRGHHRCLSLDLDELEELNWSLGRAVEAAQSVRLTTSRMSRALAAELGRPRGLRGSCLF